MTDMSYPNRAKGVWCAFLVFFIWGFTLLASSVAQETADPIVFIMYRFLLSSLFMAFPLITGRKRLRLDRKKLLCILALGLTEPVIYFPCEQFALKYTNSSFLGIMLATIPVVSMVMGTVFLRERPSRLQWFFAAVGISGIIALTLITGKADGAITVKGVLLSVLSVVTGSAYGIISKKIAPCTDSYERSLGTCVMGALMFTVWAVLRHMGDMRSIIAPLRVVSFDLSVIYVAVFASAIGYTLLNTAYDNAPTANVVAFCNLQAVIAVACGVIFLGDPFSVKAAIAMAVALVGIWGVQRFDRN